MTAAPLRKHIEKTPPYSPIKIVQFRFVSDREVHRLHSQGSIF
jgi:hypothetical protein